MHRLAKPHVLFHMLLSFLFMLLTVCCLLLGDWLRSYTGRNIYTFLRWDIFLAWTPLFIAWLGIGVCKTNFIKWRLLRISLVLVLSVTWLAFYPNAAYLVTDALHVYVHYKIDPSIRFSHELEFWLHHFLFLLASLLGLALGSYSLYLLHRQLNRRWNKLFNWIVVIGIILLSSVGIFIGRFIRWNSWDILDEPLTIVKDSYEIVMNEATAGLFTGFTLLMFFVQLFFYGVFYVIGQYGNRQGSH
ncbi:DUF1361 domain-containing protein [Paenibacillus sp. 1001270B_150601_E10]|uniref:DUF1361 domain-containing protein n=1 Tax=Paenibacillus sp. 1001270B_150601_E10 TaxID=2787079 RepID=UPI00189F1F9A|nr:DUF1361 domain-containing protein [Paenibacillus sp. 1001270B_150601_E10]